MIIKKDKEYEFLMVGILVGLIAAGFIFHLGLDVPIGIVLIILSPVMLFYLSHVVAYGRTFILTADGCLIQFLWFKKFYSWDKLITKKIVDAPKHPILAVNRAFPYKQYAVFAPFRVRKPCWLNPIYYNCIHPWSFVYINLDNPNAKNRRVKQSAECPRRGRHYEVSEKEFREKMSLWHIVLEESVPN